MNFYRTNYKGELLNANGDNIVDPFECATILQNLKLENNQYLSEHNDIVEVFDYPFHILQIKSITSDKASVRANYDIDLILDLNQIYVNYKDQFVIYTEQGLPSLLSDEAQAQLFDLADEFSDDDITIQGTTYLTQPWLKNDPDISDSKFWTNRYVENRTEWDLNEPSPSLVWSLQKFKFPKMRVAVLGCGVGHDANYFASLGHKTVGFDFSPEAIVKAESLYGKNENLTFVTQDIFNLDEQYLEQFDLVFDHTLFCAIDPDNRSDLVHVWRKLLADQGQLLGVFFTMPNMDGPPYGATEAEIKDRLGLYFRNDFWMRSRSSITRRLGKELIVLATKMS